MAIKMIITDLDGTFYHKDLSYDKDRFNKLYEKMKRDNIRFVVASGNQYYQLRSFFDYHEELSFVSENGGYIVDRNNEIFSVEIKKKTYHKILDVINEYSDIKINIVCGKNSAYVDNSMSDDDFKIFLNYFPVMKRVSNLHDVDDQIIKFALMTSEELVDEIADKLNGVIDESLSVVTSGHGCIDLIVKGVHKGNAVRKLMSIYDIKEDEIMAFGDANNDLEMLKLVGYGFVMANGNEFMKETIGRVTELSNEEDGELAVIEEYFNDPELFLMKYKETKV